MLHEMESAGVARLAVATGFAGRSKTAMRLTERAGLGTGAWV